MQFICIFLCIYTYTHTCSKTHIYTKWKVKGKLFWPLPALASLVGSTPGHRAAPPELWSSWTPRWCGWCHRIRRRRVGSSRVAWICPSWFCLSPGCGRLPAQRTARCGRRGCGCRLQAWCGGDRGRRWRSGTAPSRSRPAMPVPPASPAPRSRSPWGCRHTECCSTPAARSPSVPASPSSASASPLVPCRRSTRWARPSPPGCSLQWPPSSTPSRIQYFLCQSGALRHAFYFAFPQC